MAEDAGRRLAGIGAVKAHGDGSRELSSIATAPDRRGRGVAGAVIRTILEREKGPLFLSRRDLMTAFYGRFGFQVIGEDDMPPYFRRLHGVFSIVTAVLGIKNKLRVMRRDNGD